MGTSFRRKPEARADKTGDIWGGEEGGRKTLGHPPPDFPDRIGRTDAGILGSGRFTVSSRVRIGIGDNGASFPGYSERNHEFLFWQTKNQG